jgi:hypothetical protein
MFFCSSDHSWNNMYMLILNFTYRLRCLRVPPVEYHWFREQVAKCDKNMSRLPFHSCHRRLAFSVGFLFVTSTTPYVTITTGHWMVLLLAITHSHVVRRPPEMNALSNVLLFTRVSGAVIWIEVKVTSLRGCIQKFPDWPSGARTANGTALCR